MRYRPREGARYVHFAPRARRESIRKAGLVPAVKDEHQTLESPLGFLYLFSMTALHSPHAVKEVLPVLTHLMSDHRLVDAHVVKSPDVEAVTEYEFRTRQRISPGQIHVWKGCLAFMKRRFAAYDLYLRPKSGWCEYFWSTERGRHLRECRKLVDRMRLVHTPEWEHENMTREEVQGYVARYVAGYVWFCADDDAECKSVYLVPGRPHVSVQVDARTALFRLEKVSSNVRFQSAARFFANWAAHAKMTALLGYIAPPDYYSSVQDVVKELNAPTRSYYGDGAAYVAFILRNVLLSWFPEAHFDGWFHDTDEYRFATDGDDQPCEYLLWNFDLPGHFRYRGRVERLDALPQVLVQQVKYHNTLTHCFETDGKEE